MKKILKGEVRANRLFGLATNLSANIDIAHAIMNDLTCKFEEAYGDDKEMARKKARDKGINLVKFEIQDKSVKNLLSDAFGLREDGTHIDGKLKPDDVQFLMGGWLEVFIWGILSKYSKDIGIFDVRLGPHPGKKSDNKASKTEIENDWDIAFMYDQSLRFVECKTGDQAHDPTGNETLYKIEAIKKQLGALNIKSYLATSAPNILDGNEIREPIKRRAKLYNCTIIPDIKICEVARMEINKNPLIVREIVDLFFLNKEPFK